MVLLVQLLNQSEQESMRKSQSRMINSRSFFSQPIQYRNVIYSRNNHQTIRSQIRESDSILQQIETSKPTQSRLEQILFPKASGKSRNGSHSISSSKQSDKISSHIGLGRLARREIDKSYGAQSNRQEKTTPVREFQLQQEETSVPIDILKLNLGQIGYQSNNNDEKTIAEIDRRLEILIGKKLQLVMLETSKKRDISQSVAHLSKQKINQEFQQLIAQIRKIKNRSDFDVSILNKKIRLIQQIIAEQTTQSQLMKKYYYKLNSNKKKGKYGNFGHLKSNIASYNSKDDVNINKRQKNSMPASYLQKQIYQQSTNKNTYKQPKVEDYESYRYKQKQFALNLQPLPRSSYKRQYLYMKTSPDEKIINKDHSPFHPQRKSPLASIYQKDYTSLRSQSINYKDLDAYKNKIKVLKVDYMPRNRLDSTVYDREAYAKDVELSSSRAKIPQHLPNSRNETNFDKHRLVSENRRQYRSQDPFEPSKIKHRQLKDFQYKLKNIFKA